jgi:hypothetical protein
VLHHLFNKQPGVFYNRNSVLSLKPFFLVDPKVVCFKSWLKIHGRKYELLYLIMPHRRLSVNTYIYYILAEVPGVDRDKK